MKSRVPASIYLTGLLIICLFLSIHLQTASAQEERRGLAVKQSGQVSTLPSSSKRWALIIGVDQYKDKQIGRLNGAANDAKLLADTLVQRAGFPDDQVILLTTNQPEERQPTRVNILRRISNLASIIPKDGLLLFSFAGHGMERAGQAYLLPSDAQISDDIFFLEETALRVTSIKDRIKATNVQQVILLLDACRNDPSGRADAPNKLTEAYTRGFNFDVKNKEVTAFATLYATAVGARAYEYTEKQQGYFTWAVVEGLKGGAANEKGEITLSSLLKYIQYAVPKRISIDLGADKDQRPFAVVEGYKAEELIIAVAGPVVSSVELSYWDSIKNSVDPRDFKGYLTKYPNGQFRDIASRRVSDAAAEYARRGFAAARFGRPYDPPNWDEAIAAYRQAIALEPDNAEWHAGLGLCLARFKFYASSIGEATGGLNYLDGGPDGEPLFEKGQAELREAIRLEPGNARWYRILANLFHDRAVLAVDINKFSVAEKLFRQAIEKDPKDFYAHLMLGQTLLWLGQTLPSEDKLRDWEAKIRETVGLFPNEYVAHEGLASVLIAKKRYAEAEAELREAMRLTTLKEVKARLQELLDEIIKAQKK